MTITIEVKGLTLDPGSGSPLSYESMARIKRAASMLRNDGTDVKIIWDKKPEYEYECEHNTESK